MVFCESRLCFNVPPFSVCQPALDKGPGWLPWKRAYDYSERERGSECSKGKSLKDPLVNLIKCDENQRPRLSNACDSAEKEVVSLPKGLKGAGHNGANIVLLSEHFL